MFSLTEKAEAILKDPHLIHAVGVGVGALVVVKMMNRNKDQPSPPQIVQLASKPRNTQLIVAVGVAGLAYVYMSQYGHRSPHRNSESAIVSGVSAMVRLNQGAE